jgi:hypothetical protein
MGKQGASALTPKIDGAYLPSVTLSGLRPAAPESLPPDPCGGSPTRGSVDAIARPVPKGDALLAALGSLDEHDHRHLRGGSPGKNPCR